MKEVNNVMVQMANAEKANKKFRAAVHKLQQWLKDNDKQDVTITIVQDEIVIEASKEDFVEVRNKMREFIAQGMEDI